MTISLQNEHKEMKDSLAKSEAEKQFVLNQKNDIVAYLTRELKEKAQEVLNLNTKISSFNTANKYGKENLEKILKEQEKAYEENIQMLNNSNMQLGLFLFILNFIIYGLHKSDSKLTCFFRVKALQC